MRLVQRSLQQRRRHLHRVGRADQRQVRHALRRARRGFQRDQRAEAVADQRGLCDAGRIQQRQHEVAPLPPRCAGGSPSLLQWPGRSTASTFQPWWAK